MGTAHRVLAGATATALAILYPAAAQAADDPTTAADYTLTLTPGWHNPIPGTTHTLTATVTAQEGAAQPIGGTVLFTVTGANTGQGGPATLGEDATAAFAYAGSWGDDTVDACFDINSNDACDAGEPAAQAYVSWRAEWPFVDAFGPYSGIVGDAVTIWGYRYQIDSEHETMWDVSGPGECAFGDPAAASTTVTCDTAGMYTLTFTAYNTGYDPIPPDNAELTITAATAVNAPPTNDAGGPYSGVEGEPTTLQGVASDVDEDALTHTWLAEGPGACTFSDAHSLASSITCEAHGYYTLTLTTSDGAKSTSDTAALTIECEPQPAPTTPAPTPTETAPTPTEVPTTQTSTPSLPVTGTSLSSVMASGTLLVALGVAALLFGRIRRSRTES
jgi:hypothetical protein